jgi:hypothetical protein
MKVKLFEFFLFIIFWKNFDVISFGHKNLIKTNKKEN